jgi:hypothetical protein
MHSSKWSPGGGTSGFTGLSPLPGRQRNCPGADFEVFSRNPGQISRWLFGSPAAHGPGAAPKASGSILPVQASMKPVAARSAQPECGEQSFK